MRTRIISGLIGLAGFLAVIYVLPIWCFPFAVSVALAISAYELTWRSKIVKSKAQTVAACIWAAAAPLLIWVFNDWEKYIIVYLFSSFAVMFIIWLFGYGRVTLVMTLTSVVAGAIIPLFFSLIVRIRILPHGEFLVLFPFMMAWATDTGAYFAGTLLGRHKLCEKISPKKTIEGAVGGVVVCGGFTFAYIKIMEACFAMQFNYVTIILGALVLSCIGQIGDLSFSIIKREYNIKDYGNCIPGHGGALDRLDSTIFTIPASYILLVLMGGII